MTDTIDWDDDIASELEADDDIIELTDIADDQDAKDAGDDIIELDDIIEPEEESVEMPELELEMEKETVDESEDFSEQEEPDDLVIEEEPQHVSLPEQVTLEQIEAALERVIERQFASKIESILFEVMEKVIEKELVAIRETLQKDLDQIGNA